MSPELKAALKDWLDWFDQGQPANSGYNIKMGLCWNTSRGDRSFYDELADIFEKQGYKDKLYPFDSLSERMAWVLKQLEE